MAEPFAFAGDVAARWRTLTPDEETLADQLCEDASDMIRERWGDVDARLASGALSDSSLARVTALMVKRAMLVGDVEGLQSQAQSAGPFSINQTFANPTGNLYLTAADIALLDGLGWTARSRVGWLA